MHTKSGEAAALLQSNADNGESSPGTPRRQRYRRQSSAHALAAAEMIKNPHGQHHRHSIVDVRYGASPSRSSLTYGAVEISDCRKSAQADGADKPKKAILQRIISRTPAVAIATMLNFMVGIPFGASYFPVGWSSESTTLAGGDGSDDDEIHGAFPLPGKEALGLRMFLFSTAIAQAVFTFESKFTNGIGLQMVENVPFCLELAHIVIKEQGYGMESLSTLFFLFGLSSVIVGIVFYLLGKFQLGRVVYFFPSHVLVGCIGGIGAFIIVTAIEVTTNTTFHFTAEGVHNCIIENLHLIGVVLLFEAVLRLLMYATQDTNGKAKYPLLGPLYYCMITPIFYFFVYISGSDKRAATDAGYFFPPLNSCDGNSCDNSAHHLLDIWTVINLSTISWSAVLKAAPTMVSLVAFSLIHVPINIPAFAISTKVEPQMNAELIAHGFSNGLSGIFGGLQNYMCYSNSVIYAKSGGKGKGASLGVVLVTAALFIFGPAIASYVPRCMAGTLLLHIGIDLFLEGVYDSYGDYDALEYSGIWLIVLVMVIVGMSAALIAGVIAALSTYAFQSITYQNPIKGAMSAARLRSSACNRTSEACAILEDRKTGRHRIYIVQLQGHIFFGNATVLTDNLKAYLAEKEGTDEEPKIVILDFSPVLGMDSSAAQAIAKLKDTMHDQFNIELSIFVTGNTDGFPCEYNLSRELRVSPQTAVDEMFSVEDDANEWAGEHEDGEPTRLFHAPRVSMIDARGSEFTGGVRVSLKRAVLSRGIPSSRVCESLDSALAFAEDVLIALEDPFLLEEEIEESSHCKLNRTASTESSLDEEKILAVQYLGKLLQGASEADTENLFTLFEREKYVEDEIVWKQGSKSDSAKLLVSGNMVALLEDEGVCEDITVGSMIGELGLVNGTERLSTVQCVSSEAVLFSLSHARWEVLTREDPRLARFIDLLVVRNLSHKVQLVSNRILECRSLPV